MWRNHQRRRVGEVGNPVCGDMMNVYIKVENDRLVERQI